MIDKNRYSLEINADDKNNDENNWRNNNKIIRSKVKLFKRSIEQYINVFDNDIVKFEKNILMLKNLMKNNILMNLYLCLWR